MRYNKHDEADPIGHCKEFGFYFEGHVEPLEGCEQKKMT